MSYTPADFGLDKNGPQFAWLDERLTLHGHPPVRLMHNLKDRVRLFQLAQGWTGSGADGLVGPKTLQRLTAAPMPQPSGIDLTPWKLTLPVGEQGSPTEVFPIGHFEESPYFLNRDGSLTFRADCDGVTTSGSVYPRSELREMKGTAKASWSNVSGTHTLTGRLAVTHLPEVKPHVVCMQIHDADDDVCMVRLEGSRLFVERGGDEVGLLDADYHLRVFFDLRIVADPSGVKVIYNGTKSVPLDGLVGSDWYFKAGCYTQASSRVLEGSSKHGTGYGEVIYTALEVRHAA